MKAILTLVAVVLCGFTACGGVVKPEASRPSACIGDWAGHFAVTIGNASPREYDAGISVVAAGDGATLHGICPDGSGDADLIQFDTRLSWQGDITCKASWLGPCLVELHYTDIATSAVDGTLTLGASGYARLQPLLEACSGDLPLQTSFSGQAAPH